MPNPYKTVTIEETIDFANAMVDAGWFETAKDVIYYIEKPHKWAKEFQTWDELGRPQFGDTKWADFLNAMNHQHADD
jgi:uncharacterized protein YdaT